MLSIRISRSFAVLLFFVFCLLLTLPKAHGQMRRFFTDTDPNNKLVKLNFYSPSEGYGAFYKWVGATTDSGHTFTKRLITLSNVDYNGYRVNLTFGFEINGVKAFDANHILVYGDYGFIPSILSSDDGGQTYKLIFHSPYSALDLKPGITDMQFLSDNKVGFAVDADRIWKTVDGGKNWSPILQYPEAYFEKLQIIDNKTIIAFSTAFGKTKVLKSSDGGLTWPSFNLPANDLKSAFFLTPLKGWIAEQKDNASLVYQTNDGGASWQLMTESANGIHIEGHLYFTNDSTGYALGSGYNVLKTTTNGKIWERLERDNDFAYLYYGHEELYFWDATTFLAGGGYGFIEGTTNSGGKTLPSALFRIDTVGSGASGTTQLVNLSRPIYGYKWLVNGKYISSDYHSSYTHDPEHFYDTVSLIVSSGNHSDTLTDYQEYYPAVKITSFSPAVAGIGSTVTIEGMNFNEVGGVWFGGVPATTYTEISPTRLQATVGAGASGAVTVATSRGRGSLSGFQFIATPVISSFTPQSAKAGTVVTIKGFAFTAVSQVKFGGVPAVSYTVLSENEIQAIVPSGPSGGVEVITAGGTAGLGTYTALADLTSFSPLEGTEGTVLKINGTSLSGTSAITIGGQPVKSFHIESPDRITAIVGPGSSGLVSLTGPGNASKGIFSWYDAPVISGFTPDKGPVGTTITITGSNFDVVTDSNKVYFNGVQAKVVSGNANMLQVMVPVGAGYQQVAIHSHHLQTQSVKAFTTTFTGGGSITANSFSPSINFSLGEGHYGQVPVVADFDGDGNQDIIFPEYSDDAPAGIFIWKHTGNPASVSFDDKTHMKLYPMRDLNYGDLDGDGKQDLAVIDYDSTILIYRNTSQVGSISFAEPVKFTTGEAPTDISIADIDGDGKAELLILASENLNIHRNLSDPGNIQFAKPEKFQASGVNLVIGDMNGDDIPDIATSFWNRNIIFLFKNLSKKGQLAFSVKEMPVPSASFLVGGDLDGDGKMDLATIGNSGEKVYVLRNVSTKDDLQFTDPIPYDVGTASEAMSLSDIDGDGRVDIAARTINAKLSIIKNLSSPGTLSFGSKVEFEKGSYYGETYITTGDFNGDGKEDILTSLTPSSALSIFLNSVSPQPFIASFTPTLGQKGTVVHITGTNLTGVTSVQFGGVNASSFVIQSPELIDAIVGDGAAGNVTVSSPLGKSERPGFMFGVPPTITSVNPQSGSIGSIVKIYGHGFNTTKDQNAVYFGGVKAEVITSATDSISVRVPIGAAEKPISISVNNLTAYSALPFLVKFLPDPGISTSTFEAAKNIFQGSYVVSGDIDGDGKLDLIAGGLEGLGIALNESAPGKLNFKSFTYSLVGIVFKIVVSDINGDGKLDIVTSNSKSGTLSVFINASTPGTISLLPPYNINAARGYEVFGFAINDLDRDGRPDIILSDKFESGLIVYKNSSAATTLHFDDPVFIRLEISPDYFIVSDLNNDGKDDIAGVANSGLYIYKNLSMPGSFSFKKSAYYESGVFGSSLEVKDFDGDGKPEIAVTEYDKPLITLWKNRSESGTIQFEEAIKIPSEEIPRFIVSGDWNGDGRPDIATNNGRNGSVLLFQNNSASGNLDFLSSVELKQFTLTEGASMSDLDGDGLPDLIVNLVGPGTSIFRNSGMNVATISTCPGTDTVLHASISGATYQWQLDKGDGYVSLSDGTNYQGTRSKDLQLKQLPLEFNGYLYRCVVDTTKLSTVYKVNITGTGVTPSVRIEASASSICSGTTVSFVAIPVNGGTKPRFEWQVDGYLVGSDSDSFQTNALKDGQVVRLLMKSNATCTVLTNVGSNEIRIKVNEVGKPSVSISASAGTICPGGTLSFTANSVNGGTLPVYQWYKNGVPVGSNQNSYTSSSWKEGDIVDVSLTSNASCISTDPVKSNSIAVAIFPVNTPTIIITGNSKIEKGSSTVITATITDGGSSPVFVWEDSTAKHAWKVISGATLKVLTYQPLATGDKIRCKVTTSEPCAIVKEAGSNFIRFELTEPVPSAPGNVHVNNPVTSTLYLDSLSLADEWETVEIRNVATGEKVLEQVIRNQTSARIPVSALAEGMYLAVLRRKDGSFVTIRFLKI